MKKRTNFFKSLRFRILIILIILGIVPSVIVTYTMLHNYQDTCSFHAYGDGAGSE